MTPLTDSPNIGKTLSEKLEVIGITNLEELKKTGSEEAISQLAARDWDGVCLLMLYALEGAVQGIRWHGLSQKRKDELQVFYRSEIL